MNIWSISIDIMFYAFLSQNMLEQLVNCFTEAAAINSMSKKFYNCMYAYIVYKKSTYWVQIHYKASYLVELPYSDNS